MYYEGSYFWQLFHDTQVYTRRATSIHCGSPARQALNYNFLVLATIRRCCILMCHVGTWG